MSYLLLMAMVSVGWSAEEPAAAATEAAETQSAKSMDDTVKEWLEGVIKAGSLDVAVQTVKMKEAGKPAFQLDGTADSNATIASLVKALEGASETTKVYLVSTEKKEEDGRQVFVLTADYAAK